MPQPKPQRTRHPAVSDIALALATKRPSEPLTKVTLTDANAKGVVQITVDVNHAEPGTAAEIAGNLYDILRAKYPREANGA